MSQWKFTSLFITCALVLHRAACYLLLAEDSPQAEGASLQAHAVERGQNPARTPNALDPSSLCWRNHWEPQSTNTKPKRPISQAALTFATRWCTFSPFVTSSLSQAATDAAWLRNTFSCSSRSTDHLLMDSSNWRNVRADPVGAAAAVVVVAAADVLFKSKTEKDRQHKETLKKNARYSSCCAGGRLSQ